jgi:ketosteroid isomerase-like protein
MSQENVELLREMYARPTLAAFAESLHPQAELRQAAAVPDADDYFGREEFVRGTLRWHEEWAQFAYHPQRFVDSGESVLIAVRVSGRGRGSGVELDMDLFHLWTFREDMPWRCEVLLDESQAAKAAGLRE